MKYDKFKNGLITTDLIQPNVNVNVISRTALIRNRVSRRVFHEGNITWGVLYLFQEAQTHWLPVLGVPPRVVPHTWPVLKCCAV